MLAIVDYGAGNVFNVQKAFHKLGVATQVTDREETILAADGLVIPGVGAFKPAMEILESKGLVSTIQKAVAAGKPLLGICLGMQLLFTSSTEYGLTKGLDLIPGQVVELPRSVLAAKGLLVPQMGWNQNRLYKTDSMYSFVDNQYTYFVHSYYAQCDETYIVSTVDYGVDVPAIVQKGAVYGMQFHPEKSGKVGLDLLKAFVNSF